MWRRPSRCRSKATTWWWIFRPSFRGAREAGEPGTSRLSARDSGFATSSRLGMTNWALRMPHHPSLPGITHERDITIEAVDELAVRHRDEQREHHAEMQRQQGSHRGRVAPEQK